MPSDRNDPLAPGARSELVQLHVINSDRIEFALYERTVSDMTTTYAETQKAVARSQFEVPAKVAGRMHYATVGAVTIAAAAGVTVIAVLDPPHLFAAVSGAFVLVGAVLGVDTVAKALKKGA